MYDESFNMGFRSLELDYFRYMMHKKKHVLNGIWILDRIICDFWEKKSVGYSIAAKIGIEYLSFQTIIS